MCMEAKGWLNNEDMLQQGQHLTLTCYTGMS